MGDKLCYQEGYCRKNECNMTECSCGVNTKEIVNERVGEDRAISKKDKKINKDILEKAEPTKIPSGRLSTDKKLDGGKRLTGSDTEKSKPKGSKMSNGNSDIEKSKRKGSKTSNGSNDVEKSKHKGSKTTNGSTKSDNKKDSDKGLKEKRQTSSKDKQRGNDGSTKNKRPESSESTRGK